MPGERKMLFLSHSQTASFVMFAWALNLPLLGVFGWEMAFLANQNARGGSGPRRRKEAGSWRAGLGATEDRYRLVLWAVYRRGWYICETLHPL